MIQEVVTSLISASFIKYLEPKITEVLTSVASKTDDTVNLAIHKLYKNAFENYLLRKYEKYSILDTLVFPNKQTQLKSLYVPLTIESTVGDSILEYKIDGTYTEFLDEFFRVIVIDQAGMGKSTLSKSLFLSIIDNQVAIPILIELNRISKDNSIWDELVNQLAELDEDIDVKLLKKLISYGDFIFIFDGYDEIRLSEKDFVTKDIEDFVEKSRLNKFLMTSRPERGLSSFGDFHIFNVKPLQRTEAHQLIRNYDLYSAKPIADLLIDSIKGFRRDVEEFLENPLMVSLLYKAFDYKKDIPLKKSQFYRQVYDALFEDHDLSKEGYYKREKKCKLHSDEFERIIRHVAYVSALRGQIEYSKEDLLNCIRTSIEYYKIENINPSDYLTDLITSVPLFRNEKVTFRWAHKSLQDYFAAKFIWLDSKGMDVKIIQKIREKRIIQEKLNLLSLFYDFNPNLILEVLLVPIMKSFKEFMEQILSKDIFVSDTKLSKSELIEFGELTFNHFYYILSAPIDDVLIYHGKRKSYDFSEIITKRFGSYKFRSASFHSVTSRKSDDEIALSSVVNICDTEIGGVLDIINEKTYSFVKYSYKNSSRRRQINRKMDFPDNIIEKVDGATELINIERKYFCHYYLELHPFSKVFEYQKVIEFLEKSESDSIQSKDDLLTGW